MTSKKDLGQFFTTNSDHILQGFEGLVKGKVVLDPFAGGGDLLRWAESHGATSASGLDIDPKLVSKKISLNDSLAIIPYTKFNLTNPPYLAKNKMSPAMKDKYPLGVYEDLYLLSIKKIIHSNPDEGIIIIPVNFFSAENSDGLRKEFLTLYNVAKVNYFKTQVFEDTTYNVVAFHYVRKATPSTITQQVVFTTYPGGTSKTFSLEDKYSYRIAGNALSKITEMKPLKTIRLTEAHMEKNAGNTSVKGFFNNTDVEREYLVTSAFRKKIKSNIVLLNCIDTNCSEQGWIKAEDVRSFKKDCLVGKNTSRNIAYVLLPDCPLDVQEKIIPLFNDTLNSLRKEYNSLFLTNFRDNDRKRISFDFCYKLIAYCHDELTK